MIDETAALPPTVYASSRPRAALHLAGAAAFVAVGAAMMMSPSVLFMLIGALSVTFFGACAVGLTGRLVRRRPELVLDAAGLEHVQVGRIAWNEIAEVRVRAVNTGSAFTPYMVELVLHDPAGYLVRAPWIARANARMGYRPSFSTNTLPVDHRTIADAMLRHRPDLTVRIWGRRP
ncbi:STM3941 family protein [Kitasatospora sp. NPDC056181]|uniref:STM3941 family protein n=1 Tax=Kitasatospora sp. NPDC056181 TaxID=3345737 RepID=UPI0035D593BE